jgi:hypothetical protein
MKINEKELRRKAKEYIESGQEEDKKIRKLLDKAMQESLDRRE